MRIITMARELGALEPEQEEELCRVLKVRPVGRARLETRFRKLGLGTELSRRLDERKPGVTDTLFSRTELYFETLRLAILEEAVQTPVALIGRGANFLLEELTGCLRLRFVAPLRLRIERIARLRGCGSEEAAGMVRKNDRERQGFCGYYYRKNWSDPAAYDLVLNTGELDWTGLTAFLSRLSVLRPDLDSREDRKLQDALLEQRVRYTLRIVERLNIQFLEVVCTEGEVELRGCVPSQSMAQRIERLVRALDGVKTLRNRLTVVLAEPPHRLM